MTWLIACTAARVDSGRATRPTPGVLSVAELGIASVEHNVLARRVTVETSEPAEVVLRFGPDDELAWEIAGEQESTEHELLLVGLRPETEHLLSVEATTGDGRTAEASRTLTTEAVPAPIELGEILRHDEGEAGGGFILMNVTDYDSRPTAVIYDREGYPVWYRQIAWATVEGGVDVRLTEDGTVSMGGSLPTEARPVEVGLDGELLWEGPEQPGGQESGFMHHHFQPLGERWLTLEKAFRHGTRGDRIVEIDRLGNEHWSWNTFDGLEPRWIGEWTHANWAGSDGETVWWSDRNLDRVFAVDRESRELLWSFGEEGDFALVEGDWFAGQHAPQRLEEGRWLIYDNEGLGERSRVVEYELDHEAMTATEAWSFDGGEEDAWYTAWWGSALRLEGGNTLISAGGSYENRVFEVTPSGEIVWELHLEGTSMYRAREIELPGVEPI